MNAVRQLSNSFPEKASLDIFYLSPAKNKLFHSLPEIELPKKFNLRKLKSMTNSINSISRKKLVENRLEMLFKSI